MNLIEFTPKEIEKIKKDAVSEYKRFLIKKVEETASRITDMKSIQALGWVISVIKGE